MKPLNTGEHFEWFWEKTVKKANGNKVDEPKLPARFANFTLTTANYLSRPS